MTDKNDTPQEGNEQTEPQTPPTQPPVPGQRQGQDPDKDNGDWKDTEIAKARRQAARYRNERNDVKAQLDAVAPKLAKIDTLETKLAQVADLLAKAEEARKVSELNAARTAAANEYKLPANLAKRLQGDTPEAIMADAAELAKDLPQPPPRGGRFSPGNTGENVSGPKVVDSILENLRGRKTGPSAANDKNVHRAKGGGVVGIDTD